MWFLDVGVSVRRRCLIEVRLVSLLGDGQRCYFLSSWLFFNHVPCHSLLLFFYFTDEKALRELEHREEYSRLFRMHGESRKEVMSICVD